MYDLMHRGLKVISRAQTLPRLASRAEAIHAVARKQFELVLERYLVPAVWLIDALMRACVGVGASWRILLPPPRRTLVGTGFTAV